MKSKLYSQNYFKRKLTKYIFFNFLSDFKQNFKFEYNPIFYFIEDLIPNSIKLYDECILKDNVKFYLTKGYNFDQITAIIDISDEEIEEQYYDLPKWVVNYNELYQNIIYLRRNSKVSVDHAIKILELIE